MHIFDVPSLENTTRAHTYGESIDVGNLLRTVKFFRNLNVLVVSDSSWMWTIASTQLGFGSVSCLPLGKIGKENLNVILWAKLSLLSNVKVLNAVLESYDLLLVDLSYQDTLDDVPLSAAPKIVLLGSAKAAALFGSDRSEPTWKHKLTHRKLGGLTSCSQVFNWKGVDGHLVRLRHGSYPIRPLGKFVDIAADLPRGTTACELAQHEPFWNIDSLEPFPWPPASWPLSIRVPSVYLKGERVVRYLSSKEACQLLDIPGIWSTELVSNIWSWSNGNPIPLRFSVEFLLRGSLWISSSQQNDLLILQDSPQSPSNDISRLLVKAGSEYG